MLFKIENKELAKYSVPYKVPAAKQKVRSVSDAIAFTFRSTPVENFTCRTCGQTSVAAMELFMLSAPNYLIVNIKRQESTGTTIVKDKRNIENLTEIDLCDYLLIEGSI